MRCFGHAALRFLSELAGLKWLFQGGVRDYCTPNGWWCSGEGVRVGVRLCIKGGVSSVMRLSVYSNNCGVDSGAGLRWSNVLCPYVFGMSSYRGAVVAHWYVGCRLFPGVGNCHGVPLQRLSFLLRGNGRVARGRGPALSLGERVWERE